MKLIAQIPTIFKSLPDILKFGVLGLVAIFAVLLFFLFRQAPTKARFTFVLLPFTIVTLLLIGMSSYSVYVFKNIDNNKTIDSLKEELRIYQGSSAANETLQHEYKKILSNRDSLDVVIGHVKHLVKDKETLLSNNVMLLIIEAFENVTNETSGKAHHSISEETLTFLRFKNAIFQKIYDFGADTAILRKVLIKLKSRGAEINVDQLVKVTPSLIQLKRAWLKDALLVLGNEEERLSHTPVQEGAKVTLPLPKEVWILPNTPFEVTLTDDNYPRLEFEKELLNKVDL